MVEEEEEGEEMPEEVVLKNPTGMLKKTTTWLKEAPVLPSLALLWLRLAALLPSWLLPAQGAPQLAVLVAAEAAVPVSARPHLPAPGLMQLRRRPLPGVAAPLLRSALLPRPRAGPRFRLVLVGLLLGHSRLRHLLPCLALARPCLLRRLVCLEERLAAPPLLLVVPLLGPVVTSLSPSGDRSRLTSVFGMMSSSPMGSRLAHPVLSATRSRLGKSMSGTCGSAHPCCANGTPFLITDCCSARRGPIPRVLPLLVCSVLSG